MLIHKIFTKNEFIKIMSKGYFKGNTNDLKRGFIHLCFPHQKEFIINKYFKNKNYIVANIDSNKLINIKFEMKNELYPHLYGKLFYKDIISFYSNK